MIRISLTAALICLSGCQQGTKAADNSANASKSAAAANVATPANSAAAAPPASAPSRAAVPASYDWTFATHGGSGELVFGDGDLAEGVALLNFSCLPGSGQTEISWNGAAQVVLTAEGGSATVSPEGSLSVDHPVLRSLAGSGAITMVSDGAERTLTAKPGAGRTAVESFFAYCAAGGRQG